MKLSKRAWAEVERLVESRIKMYVDNHRIVESPEMESRVNHRMISDAITQNPILQGAIENGVETLFRTILFKTLPDVIVSAYRDAGLPQDVETIKDAIENAVGPELFESSLSDVMGSMDVVISDAIDNVILNMDAV